MFLTFLRFFVSSTSSSNCFTVAVVALALPRLHFACSCLGTCESFHFHHHIQCFLGWHLGSSKMYRLCLFCASLRGIIGRELELLYVLKPRGSPGGRAS